MRTRVSQRLDEAGTPVYYTAVEINAALNEALRFFCLLTLGLEITATWTPSGTFAHMMGVFADWVTVLRITDATGAQVRPATLADLASLDPSWPFDSATPARYVCLGADLIGLYGSPVMPLNVTYVQAPATLVLDTDTPAIPAEYHPRLIEYAIYRCRQIEGLQEFSKTLKYFASFIAGAQQYGAYVRSRNIGSRYDKVPMQLELYDRSKLLGLRPELLSGALVPQGPGTVPTEAK